ncbi:hypothetical protein DFR59_10253 [Falsibacillus pallidus]|uniref:Uncharacterized protein n=1 Tax=Falsibacillus pallidus TaxID=493781 RepID=A0A370GNW2_9BACI|nr:hypothetical protein DFR59_10253 [Falsibacillus pallidus]
MGFFLIFISWGDVFFREVFHVMICPYAGKGA